MGSRPTARSATFRAGCRVQSLQLDASAGVLEGRSHRTARRALAGTGNDNGKQALRSLRHSRRQRSGAGERDAVSAHGRSRRGRRPGCAGCFVDIARLAGQGADRRVACRDRRCRRVVCDARAGGGTHRRRRNAAARAGGGRRRNGRAADAVTLVAVVRIDVADRAGDCEVEGRRRSRAGDRCAKARTCAKATCIARIDTRNLQAQYDRELAAVEKARADLDLATLNRDKNRVAARAELHLAEHVRGHRERLCRQRRQPQARRGAGAPREDQPRRRRRSRAVRRHDRQASRAAGREGVDGLGDRDAGRSAPDGARSGACRPRTFPSVQHRSDRRASRSAVSARGNSPARCSASTR